MLTVEKLKKNAFRPISISKWKKLLVLYFLIYVYIFYLLRYVTVFQRLHESCLVKTRETCLPIWIFRLLRGTNYFNGSTKAHECAVTFWELTHFSLHTFLGYAYNLPVSLTTSVCFELFESYRDRSGSFLDLAWNGAGYFVGLLAGSLVSH